MKILGANVGTLPSGKPIYDGGCCLLIDGELVIAIAEERVSRKKHDGGYRKGIPYILKHVKMSLDDIDLVVLSTYGDLPPSSLEERYHIPQMKLADRVIVMPSHHLAHAFSAFIPSPFDEALIIVMDNEGNLLTSQSNKDYWKNPMERVSIYIGKGHEIELLERDMDMAGDASLGEVYGNFTKFLGLGNYLNAGKTMGLAPFGRYERFKGVELFDMHDGHMHSRMRDCYSDPIPEFIRFFEEEYKIKVEPRLPSDPIEEIHEDFAYLIQDRLEKIVVKRINDLVIRTGHKKLCLAGGVGLNCVMNRKILDQTPIEEIWVQPNSGDQGVCYGNALYGYYKVIEGKERFPMPHVSLGGGFSDQEIKNVLEEHVVANKIKFGKPNSIVNFVANLIFKGHVVGWFQGKSEFGPRALGHRSILADPRLAEMKDILNKQIKYRESFRPYAPSILLEDVREYFDIPQPSPFMLLVANVYLEKRELIPAVTHVDGTARVQTVTRESNGIYYDLIREFKNLTGIPILLNTSFNLSGEPIVETPIDAIDTFLRSNIDYLAIGSYVVEKPSDK